jgi:3-polyprenyl-4-hydroxybenzoate decarboxylase
LRRFVFLQFKSGSARSEIWRALYGTMSLQAAIGKYVIAVDQDIDPDNADAIFWAMGYRCNPSEDIRIIDYREQGHGPRSDEGPRLDSAMLVDATMKSPMPPLALPKKEYMEQAKAMWEKLGLPPLKPEMPWYGYTLGDWTEEWDRNAKQATDGEWMQRDAAYQARKRKGVEPNTPVRGIEGKRDDPQA